MSEPNEHFDTLAEIVCRHYGQPVGLVLSKRRHHSVTHPRNIIGAIWSNGNTLADTAYRCGWRAPQSTLHAQRRILALLESPAHAYRIDKIMEEVAEKLPWLAITDKEPEPTRP